ncbi:MAG: DUF2461 domain-containing protein [Actinomycetota bacterium]
MSDHFSGFPQEGLDFLTTLGRSDKAWFDANRKTYNTAVAAPAKALVTAVGERLADGIAPAIEAQPKANGSIAPINNDLRFSPDKPPYKDHLLLRFWEGSNKKTAPTLFLRVSAGGIGYATGVMFDDVDRWRHAIDDDITGEALTDALGALGADRAIDLDGAGYKRVPKPYPADHPRADLLKHKAFQARWQEPTPSAITEAAFVDHCVERLEACADVHRWLVTNL